MFRFGSDIEGSVKVESYVFDFLELFEERFLDFLVLFLRKCHFSFLNSRFNFANGIRLD